MSTCTACAAPLTDGGHFSPSSGAMICRACLSKEQMGEAQSRANASLAAQGYAPMGTPPPSRGKGIAIGAGIVAVAAFWFVAGLSMDKVYFYPPVLFVLGLAQLGRALMQKS